MDILGVYSVLCAIGGLICTWRLSKDSASNDDVNPKDNVLQFPNKRKA